MSTHVCDKNKPLISNVHMLRNIPVQVGAVPLHTPTALLPSPVQILTSSPPSLSMPSGQLMVYIARVPTEKGGVVSVE